MTQERTPSPAPVDLAGTGVLVTRPAHQAEGLCRLVEAAGGRAIRFPVLEIAEPRNPAALQAVIDRLQDYDLALFISANAVERGLARIEAAGPWPPRLHSAAIGAASARELEHHGRRVDIRPRGRYDSEALLALPQLQDLRGRRVVIFRGEGGRELLADTLRQRGARVDYAEVYRRVRPTAPDTAGLLKCWERGEIQVVVVTSSEGLRNLCDLLPSPTHPRLYRTPLVVVSERMLQLAQELGFTAQIVVAERAADDAIVAAIGRCGSGVSN
jgi:uroporphyrinogen-III synthase